MGKGEGESQQDRYHAGSPPNQICHLDYDSMIMNDLVMNAIIIP